MRKEPFITVIIPLYNKENSIENTIHSVLCQTMSDFELLIINDGSTDNSGHVVSKISDPRIRLINKTNGGVSSARNEGIRLANTEYIAFIDGDDIWRNNHLEILKNAIFKFDSPNVGGFATSFYKSEENWFNDLMYKEEEPVYVKDYFEMMAQPVTKFNSSTILVKKSKVLLTGLFSEHLQYGEDVEFWHRLFQKFDLVFVDAITVNYYTHAENRSVYKVIPLSKRFHRFDYEEASLSQKRYYDKLVGILLIDYMSKFSLINLWRITRMYPDRLLKAFRYIASLKS